jgi:hypothetical protein
VDGVELSIDSLVEESESLGGSWVEVLKRLWSGIERAVLQGQRLQGISTCREVLHALRKMGAVPGADLEISPEGVDVYLLSHTNLFPLMTRIYRIAILGDHPNSLFRFL